MDPLDTGQTRRQAADAPDQHGRVRAGGRERASRAPRHLLTARRGRARAGCARMRSGTACEPVAPGAARRRTPLLHAAGPSPRPASPPTFRPPAQTPLQSACLSVCPALERGRNVGKGWRRKGRFEEVMRRPCLCGPYDGAVAARRRPEALRTPSRRWEGAARPAARGRRGLLSVSAGFIAALRREGGASPYVALPSLCVPQ